MDVAPEELQFLTLTDILKESISIPRSSPRTFSLITLTLVFPLSFAILAHSLFTHPILNYIETHPSSPKNHQEWITLFIFQFFYILFLFAFSLLSTAATVFTVASIYTSKPTSFSSTLSAFPRVLYRLIKTFLWVSIVMTIYNFIFLMVVLGIIIALDINSPILLFISILAFIMMFLFVHVYITALWHLASVVSVLEPLYGLAAMGKSRQLLKGKTPIAAALVFGYLALCAGIEGVFGVVVVRGGEYGYGVWIRILVGGFLVGVLVVVNLVGLLVQSVFYYVCKSYHHQEIDKRALYDHLGGYLGEYVPLKSSVQMEEM
ncbi:uncharacterized protein LOC143892575 [Tasmannia lanceolata]|uniref:uncharacterized protein LOC143892575 n=1 Tax=Tasmannia lanceolata TaxID=3420 RepID=UPI004064B97C